MDAGEKYPAIVRLYEMDLRDNPNLSRISFAKVLGISDETLNSAFKYCNFVEEDLIP